MREMVDKVKKGEPLYGTTDLTPYMQGVAARNSRFSALMANVVPWANFVNHNQVSTEHSPPCSAIDGLCQSMVSTPQSITNKLRESSRLRKPAGEALDKRPTQAPWLFNLKELHVDALAGGPAGLANVNKA
jgi:hypothetical protein